ncbi:MAG: FAD binding domain-containing protein [Deltaproteobacteria bacterium]|nr:FAD binding domain-containing protein [Deltaproteobacteria bacterium]
MLRLPQFEVAEPASVDEAVQILKAHEGRARPMAGGTDLMPNMKHEIVVPEVVVGLWRIPGLKGVRIEEGAMHIGALTTLDELAQHPDVQAYLPALAEAVGMVAGPQLRRMGTIGGNVCLDTRCVYINQTYFWRQALGFCLKKDGTVCHVVKGGRRCVAAASNDSAPVLTLLDTRLLVQSAAGIREVALADFYVANGAFNQAREPDDLVTEIVVPLPAPGTLMAYTKLRTRAAIDFPELGVAVRALPGPDGLLTELDVCVTALAARPVRLAIEPELYQGRPLDEAVIEAVAQLAYKRCKPQTNIASDPAYRREMVPVFVRRALRRAVARGPVAG